MRNQPNKIYLQIDLEDNGETCEDFNELSDISWCVDKIYSDDLEYISVSFISAEIEKELKICKESRKMALSTREVFLKQMKKELKNLAGKG